MRLERLDGSLELGVLGQQRVEAGRRLRRSGAGLLARARASSISSVCAPAGSTADAPSPREQAARQLAGAGPWEVVGRTCTHGSVSATARVVATRATYQLDMALQAGRTGCDASPRAVAETVIHWPADRPARADGPASPIVGSARVPASRDNASEP